MGGVGPPLQAKRGRTKQWCGQGDHFLAPNSRSKTWPTKMGTFWAAESKKYKNKKNKLFLERVHSSQSNRGSGGKLPLPSLFRTLFFGVFCLVTTPAVVLLVGHNFHSYVFLRISRTDPNIFHRSFLTPGTTSSSSRLRRRCASRSFPATMAASRAGSVCGRRSGS